MGSVVEALVRLGGSATSAELAWAATPAAVKAAVQRGEVERLARGIYGLPGLGADRLAAIAYDGVVSHLSAATAWNLPLLVRPEKPHITVPVKRRPRPGRPVVMHWAAVSSAERLSRLTSLPRTVVDCARILPFGEALAVADAALSRGRLTHEELQAAAIAYARTGTSERGPGRGRRQRLLRELPRVDPPQPADHGRHRRVRAAGCRRHRRLPGTGRPGHRPARIALEAEGYEFHGSAGDFAADCRRYDDLVAAGWLVLRFTYQQVIGDPQWVVATVRSALAQRLGVPKNG